MLENATLQAFVLATDRSRSLAFFEAALGLKMLSEDEFGIEFEVGGGILRVAFIESFTPQKGTVVGWRVPDVRVAASELAKRGIAFERFPGMEQDEAGVWTPPGGGAVAWFRDPDGNTLSISGPA